MIRRIKFEDQRTTALGCNGSIQQHGIELLGMGKLADEEPLVRFYPITSKNEAGRGYVSVPVSEIDRVIIALQEIKEEYYG